MWSWHGECFCFKKRKNWQTHWEKTISSLCLLSCLRKEHTKPHTNTHMHILIHVRIHMVLCTEKSPKGILLTLLHRPICLCTGICMNLTFYTWANLRPQNSFPTLHTQKRHFTKIKTIAGCFWCVTWKLWILQRWTYCVWKFIWSNFYCHEVR